MLLLLGSTCILCWEIFFLGSHSLLFFVFRGMEKSVGSKKAQSNDAFLAELQSALSKASEKGSAFVTMKQTKEGTETVCLVRCKYQNHKASTVVRAKGETKKGRKRKGKQRRKKKKKSFFCFFFFGFVFLVFKNRGSDLVRFQTRLSAVLKQTWSSALPKKPSKRALRGSKSQDNTAVKRAKD